jgi:hypothetical protein
MSDQKVTRYEARNGNVVKIYENGEYEFLLLDNLSEKQAVDFCRTLNGELIASHRVIAELEMENQTMKDASQTEKSGTISQQKQEAQLKEEITLAVQHWVMYWDLELEQNCEDKDLQNLMKAIEDFLHYQARNES